MGLTWDSIDQGGRVAGAETVVDVDDGHARGARVEHAEKRGDAAERSAVTDRGRNCDDGALDESADDARESSLHARDDDEHARGAKARRFREQAMQARDADVGQVFRAGAEHAGGEDGFFRDRAIGRAGADDEDVARESALVRLGIALARDGVGGLVVLGPRDRLEQRGGALRRDSRHEQPVVVLENRARDVDELRGRLPGPVDDLGMTATQLAMDVEPRMPEVANTLCGGRRAELLEGALDGEFTRAQGLEEGAQVAGGVLRGEGQMAGKSNRENPENECNQSGQWQSSSYQMAWAPLEVRKRVMKQTLIVIALLAVIAATLLKTGYLKAGAAKPEPARTAAGEQVDEALVAEAEEAVRQPAAPGGPEHPELSDEELRALLLMIAAARDESDIEEALKPIALNPKSGLRVLAMLEQGLLKTSVSDLSEEERGAVQALVFLAAIYNGGESTGFLQAEGVHVDGRAFLVKVLRALPNIPSPAKGALAEGLGSVTIEGEHLIDMTYLDEILQLRSKSPDDRELFSALLENMAGELSESERQDFYTLFVTEIDDPTMVRVALSNLLQGAQAERFAALAQLLLDEHGHESPALRREILGAVAASAPPKLAAEFLGKNAASDLLAEFHNLGGRPGGLDALADEYNSLVAGGLRPEARKLLVSGMEGEELLVGIAKTDPDPVVRGQALLTATLDSAGASGIVFDTLESAWLNRGDGAAGMPTYQIISSAGNLANPGQHSPENSKKAVALLKTIASSEGLSTSEQKSVFGKLKLVLSAEEFESFKYSIGAE